MIGLFALTISPGLAIAIYVYWRDKFEKDPFWFLAKCFILGALSIIPAIALEYFFSNNFRLDEATSLWKTLIESFIFIGLVEEGCKYACLKIFIFNRNEFNEPYNGITYAVMISMGFATIENLIYVYSENSSNGITTAIIRAFTSVPAHAVNGVMMGYFVGLAKMNPKHQRKLSIIGLIVATCFHGAYDFFLMEKSIPGLTFGALIALIVGVCFSFHAIRIHIKSSYLNTIDSKQEDNRN